MGNFKTENLELLQIQKQIITNYGDDVKSKFIIGDALMKAKEHCESDTQSTKEADTMFENLVNTLPFGKVVANKYIAIAKTDFLRKLSEDDTTVGNLPSGYNNLFSYTKEEIKNDELDSLDHSKIYRLYRTFPDNFEDFNTIFSVKEGEDPNYTGTVYTEKYLPRIKFFFKLSRIIPKENYFDKLIRISMWGKWDTDVGYNFQRKLYFIITNNGNGDSSLFISRLMNFSKEEQKSVWYFYFDGPHPPKEIPEHLAFIQEANPEMYTLI